jgi:hypothetical protein
MGLFSDLINLTNEIKLDDVKKAVKEVSKLVNEAAEKSGIDLKDAAEKAKAAEASQGGAAPAFTGYKRVSPVPEAEEEPSGFSWGPTMPAEENQYNYNGSYLQYFDHVFAEDFPDLKFERQPGYGGNSTVYTFTEGDRIALVVELLSRKSSSVKLRQGCRQQGIPYLRFYFDYDGWWNTRAYIDERVKKALGR